MSVIVNLQCAGLPRSGLLGQRRPMMVLHARTANTAWREVGKTEPSPNRVNPKFIAHFVFRADQVAITLLRAEIFSVDTGNVFSKRQLLGERTIALVDLLTDLEELAGNDENGAPLPLKVVAGLPLADAPLPRNTSATPAPTPMPMPTLRLLAQRIAPMRQHRLIVNVAVFGMNLQNYGWTYVMSRVSSTDGRTKVPLYASELISGKGHFQPATIATECLCDAFETVLSLELFTAGTVRCLGSLRAPLRVLLEVDVRDRRPLWHDELNVRVEDGQIQIKHNELDPDLIHLGFRINTWRGERNSITRTLSRSITATLSAAAGRPTTSKQHALPPPHTGVPSALERGQPVDEDEQPVELRRAASDQNLTASELGSSSRLSGRSPRRFSSQGNI